MLSAADGGALEAALPQADPPPGAKPRGSREIGREEMTALHRAVAAVRYADSRHGGGSAQAQAAAHLLDQWVRPMLGRPLTDDRQRELCAVSAELARLAGWAALDTGRHSAARHYFDRALYWARTANAPDLTAYVLTTAALHTTLYGRPGDALALIDGALGTAGHVHARVVGFTKLVEARAHARAGDARAVAAALTTAERLLDKPCSHGAPEWIDFFTHPRLAADAAEIHRDLGDVRACLAWHEQASAMAPNAFTRSVGLRLTVVATVHLKAGDLEQSLALGHRALDILRYVDSNRARDYVRRLAVGLTSHRTLRAVDAFLARLRQEFAPAGHPAPVA
ncbi:MULTISPECIES: sporulation protein [Streptomyces]|uniref:sporulation protein n=1 Tax=Streptomyces TaxID=1883 RepID=UPI00167064F5|nr:sporulation protein [Streptomyces ruber]